MLSVSWTLIDDVLAAAGSLDAKIVIDTTNQFGREGWEDLGGRTAAQVNAARMPGARYTKAFNTLTSGFQAQAAGRTGPDRVVMFLCGDDEEAKRDRRRAHRGRGLHAGRHGRHRRRGADGGPPARGRRLRRGGPRAGGAGVRREPPSNVRIDRLETFSDGVFAIAITLLALDLPRPQGDDVWHALAHSWESYASFLISFLTIGIIWLNHHALFDRVTRADRTLQMLNVLLLLWVSIIPWPTGWSPTTSAAPAPRPRPPSTASSSSAWP